MHDGLEDERAIVRIVTEDAGFGGFLTRASSVYELPQTGRRQALYLLAAAHFLHNSPILHGD